MLIPYPARRQYWCPKRLANRAITKPDTDSILDSLYGMEPDWVISSNQLHNHWVPPIAFVGS
jgi:hypothetical protein